MTAVRHSIVRAIWFCALGCSIAHADPPTTPSTTQPISIASPSNGAQLVGGDVPLTIKVQGVASRSEIKKILVNDKEVEIKDPPATRGILGPGQSADQPGGASAKPDDKSLLTVLISLPTNPGNYTIEVVPNSGASSQIKVEVAPPDGPGPPRSKLVLLSVGVSNYLNKDYTLRYPAKDARDIAELFTGQTGLLFTEVKTRVVSDQSADKGQILDALDWLQHETTSRDMAVLFLAGHGVRDGSSGTYYYLPYDADMNAVKRTLLSAEDIKTTLRSMPGKVVVFLDTCFAGGLFAKDAEEQQRSVSDIDSFVQDLLQTDAGVAVFASTTGQQTARESPEWGNGVFTKAVVEGLSGKALSGDRKDVTINQLSSYVGDRVKELTGGMQTPTLAMPSGMTDFPIAIVSSEPRRVISITDTQWVPPPGQAAKKQPWWVWTLVGVGAAGVAAAIITPSVLLTRPDPTPLYMPMARF